MHLHEYQAKKIFQEYGMPVPPFSVASTIDDVKKMIKKYSWQKAVLKIQVHAGGRGKAGGIKFAHSPKEIIEHAQTLLGMKIINDQTGFNGMTAHEILITSPVEIAKEYYLSATIDRNLGKPILLASPQGGIEIEEIVKSHPSKIVKFPFDLSGNIHPFHLRYLAKFMDWPQEIHNQCFTLVSKICKMFIEKDASLIEINPLVLTKQNEFLALDAKMTIDDNALYRQPSLKNCYDPTQESPYEVEAKRHSLVYIELSGNIGCIFNGAGLAMAAIDLIKSFHKSPANFLDVGGTATADKILEGLKILMSNPKVKAILIHVFGTTIDCKEFALAATQILKNHPLPLVIRVDGLKMEEGQKILINSGLDIQIADSLQKAIQCIVKAV